MRLGVVQWRHASTIVLAVMLSVGSACDVEPNFGVIDEPDVADGPAGCPTNWLPVREEALVAGHARVEDGALILAGADEVEVRALLGAQPVEGKKFVLRLELSKVALADGGKLEVTLLSPIGLLAALTVQNEGAVLFVEAFPEGQLVEFPLKQAPETLVVELESRPDLSVAIRAFFGPAGDGKVIALGVDRFEGGLVTPALTLSGRTSEVRLDRYSKVDPTGGVADDFACNSLGTTFDLDRWPAGRVPNAGGSCTHEFECGAGEHCIDAVCRTTCLASGECPGTICIFGAAGGTCRLPNETDCDDAPVGLVCGPDDTARHPCVRPEDCPGPDDLCVGGACVANDEDIEDQDTDWGTCPAGVLRCSGDDVQICDLGGPGWNRVETCPAGECLQDATSARCDDCVRACEGEDVFERCGDATTYTLAVDCRDGFEVCSLGDDRRAAPHCRALVAPAAPASPVALPGFRIDPTEVTRAAYIGFLQTNPNPSLQPAPCAWNTSFAPRDWPWFDGPARAAQVDFCDAQAYCAWTGKRLCGAVSGGPITAAMLGNAGVDAWYAACSAGGQLAFPYGNTYEADRCSNDPRRDVGTSPGCTTTVVDFTGVYDLIGGVGEWIDACVPDSGDTPAADSCRTRGTSATEPCTAARIMRRDSTAGFRCCAPP